MNSALPDLTSNSYGYVPATASATLFRQLLASAHTNQRRHLQEVNVTLFGPVVRGWTINRPLAVMVERDTDGSYVASSDEFLVHGDGDVAGAAVRDFAQCLTEYYEMVEAGAAEGNEFDKAELARLREVIARLPPR